MRSSSGQVRAPIRGFRLGELAQCHCPMQNPVALHQSQIRSDDYLLGSEQLSNARRGLFIKKPCQNGT